MKRIMMILVAAMFLFGISAQAMAYFEDGNLIRVVYERNGTKEVVTDLGAMESVLRAPTSTNYLFNTNNFNLSEFGGSADWSNLYVAYFIRTNTANGYSTNSAWTSGPQTGQISGYKTWNQYNTNFGYVQGLYYSGGTGPAHQIVNQAEDFSYWKKMDFGSTANNGSFGGFLRSDHNTGEVSLSALSAPGGYVDQWIYYYTGMNALTGEKTGAQIALIRTWANGSTEINPETIPIPATVYLLGSGLLSLIGIRRKMAA